MEDPKQSLIARVQQANNVLVTVTTNPSVDQLAGAIGLTLLLNKLGKHATAVFSGQVPDALEFLEPEAIIEKNTDSLRDFIIALDKAKADKLRYKVEDQFVKIFISPYHTALSEKDLEFSQGDYNVDLVIALGAHEQKDLDQAIVSHGRILHDATVSSINNEAAGNLGTINWVDPNASSLCEMLFELAAEIQPDALDPQTATALLTGIVAATHRFGNDKTTAGSLDASARLISAGANQQLVASKLEDKPLPIPEKKAKPAPAPEPKPIAKQEPDDTPGAVDTHQEPEAIPQKAGELEIEHESDEASENDSQIHIDENGVVKTVEEPESEEVPRPILPSTDEITTGLASAAAMTDPLASQSNSGIPLLSHKSGPAAGIQPLSSAPAIKPLAPLESSAPIPAPPAAVPEAKPLSLDAARDAVSRVANELPDYPPKPRADLNAAPIDLGNTSQPAPAVPAMSFTTTPIAPPTTPALPPLEPPKPPEQIQDQPAPPPVPPPMTPPAFTHTPEPPKPATATDNAL